MSFLELFEKKKLIAAHRGASFKYPENTMLSMQESIGLCDFIEIDTQLSSDGVAVVIHDSTLERTTDIKQHLIFQERFPYRVSEFRYDELSLLDYGAGESVLTLKDALEFIKENELYVNIDVKDMSDSFSDKQVVSTVLNEVLSLGLEESVLISSFKHEYLPLVKQVNKKIATSALVDKKHPKNILEYLQSLDVNGYSFNKNILQKNLVKKLRSEGYFVGVYVVNNHEQQKELFDLGVNVIFTDL